MTGDVVKTPHPNTANIVILLLAAGASSRMRGRDKLVEKINGVPLLRRVALACVTSGAAEVRVILRPQDTARRHALAGLPLVIFENPDWRAGMATSLKCALAPNADGVLVVLGDMPDIRAQDLDALIAAYQPETGKTICRATDAAGNPGNPVLIGRAHFGALGRLEGDTGARAIIGANRGAVHLVALPGLAAQTDLDTPEDWAAYRDARP